MEEEMEGRRDVNIREKIDHTFPNEKFRVTAQLQSLRRFVHLK